MKSRRGEGVVPDAVQNLLNYNPMTGLIASFRAAVLGGIIPWGWLAYSTVVIFATFCASCLYFHRVERVFADII